MLLLLALPARAESWPSGWSLTETEKPYAISGTTGAALYASIGENGPLIKDSRAIAVTTFSLKWRRDYRRDGQACVLKSALPFLVVTTVLPRPSSKLPPETRAVWARFIAGIRAHEAVHAEDIRTLVREIHADTVGFRVENDPGCTKIRKAIEVPLAAASARRQEKSRAFDKAELAEGGGLRALILGLVNGG